MADEVAVAGGGFAGGQVLGAGEEVIAGPGLPTIYVVAAGTTALGALLTGLALRATPARV